MKLSNFQHFNNHDNKLTLNESSLSNFSETLNPLHTKNIQFQPFANFAYLFSHWNLINRHARRNLPSDIFPHTSVSFAPTHFRYLRLFRTFSARLGAPDGDVTSYSDAIWSLEGRDCIDFFRCSWKRWGGCRVSVLCCMSRGVRVV